MGPIIPMDELKAEWDREKSWAFPQSATNFGLSDSVPKPLRGGLTKRELFAAMAMQGLLTNPEFSASLREANWAVKAADALIAELTKEQTNG